jgi:ketosteroid isomerase-like protein
MTNPTTKGEFDAVRQMALNWTTAVERKSLDALTRQMTDDIVVVHGNGRTFQA